MTTSERKRIAEEWMNHVAGDFKIIIHIGGPSIESCKELAVHAGEIGAFGIGIIGPNFFRPPTVEILVEFISEIAATVPDLPVYYYHMPAMSGVYLPMQEFLQQASVEIPNLAGLKFTHLDLMELNQCMMVENGKYDLFWGSDETLLGALSLGVNAAVGSTYNLMPSVYLKLMECFREGNLEKARDLQRLSVNLVAILRKYGGGVVCGKSIMNLMGMNLGPCRLPIRNLSSSQIDQLKKDLEGIRFFNTKELMQTIEP
jgi:N-acetylneuraminate lyase